MGIFDFLSDLSKSGKNDLGLGGLKSLLGTRGAAPMGSRGDEMMSKTSEDSLPGYFDPNTREYVPWYVDLFNGGGLNSAGGEAAKMPAAETGLLGSGPSPRRVGVQAQAALAAPDFEYDYPTEFQPSAEPSSMQSLDQPFGSRIVPASTSGPSSQPFDRDIQRDMPAYPAQAFGGTDTMMGRQVNPNAPVDPAEFQRFRSKFEDNFKRNGIWGNTEREQAAFQYQKSRGANY